MELGIYENLSNVEYHASVVKSLLNADDYVHEAIWYKIDDYTHGSVGIYKSKVAYEDFKEANATQREFAAGDTGKSP
jgi:hypothetical protein